MYLGDISNFNQISDYVPILTSALVVDMTIMALTIGGGVHIQSLNNWYNKFGLAAVIADVLIIVIGLIIARFLYPFLFTKYSLALFLGLALIVQLVHDLMFGLALTYMPRKKSDMIDIFKDYAKESGLQILFADAIMMLSTVVLASYLATWSINSNIIALIVAVYVLPYLLYSLPK